jgi:hypothetical protein
MLYSTLIYIMEISLVPEAQLVVRASEIKLHIGYWRPAESVAQIYRTLIAVLDL